MLICGPSGCGKANTLMHMIHQLLYYDKIYLHSKNLEQPKYTRLLKKFAPISTECGYEAIESSNDEIIPVSELSDENQKLIIFDDFLCEKKQKPLVEYFIRGRHKNCSVIYLSQSYYLTPKDISVTGMTFNNSVGLKRFGFYKGSSAKVIDNIIKYEKLHGSAI